MKSILVWMALMGGLAACTPLQPVKSEPPSTYALEAKFAAPASARSDGPVLAVNLPRALPGFDTERMAYVRKPYELEYFTKNRWVDTPARMLAPLLVKALEGEAGFRAVVTAQGGVAAPLRLDTEIVRLQQEFFSAPSQMRLTLRAQLVDTAKRQVLAVREFETVEKAASDDPYGGVVAANRALETLLPQIAAFCAEQAKGKQP